jgi:predicted nucleotidyltransferase
MKNLRDDDYLLEVTVRVAVRKQHAPAIIALNENPFEDDETEQGKVLNSVIQMVDDGLLKHESLIDYAGASAWRVPTLKHFEDFRTLGELSHRTKVHKDKPKLESPLLKKRNKGKKISLDTADRLFVGFQERLNRVSDHEEFGVAVPLVLLFGSYLRREPEVGDIDLSVMTLPKPNHEVRKKELIEAGRFSSSFMEELCGPEKEVLQFLKNRSGWLALHDFSEAPRLKDLSFKVVHCSAEFQPLLDRLQRNGLSDEEFLKAADVLRAQLHTEVFKSLGQ